MPVDGESVLRWGICSTGKISHDFTSCVNALPDAEHKVVSVAARSLKTAQDFADSHNIKTAYGSYAELAEDPNIDVVYVGVIHPYHYSCTKMMLEAGKHVLCEKPLCVNVGETKSLLELAKSKNLFLMEAIWTRAFPVVKKCQELIKSGVIGEVLHVRASFTRNFGKLAARVSEKNLAGGATIDIGVYPVQWAQLIFGEKPISQSTTGFFLESGVDAESYIILEYSNNRRALLSNSYLYWGPSDVVISGPKGYIKICDPCWCPQKMILNVAGKPEEEFFYDLPKVDVQMSYDNGEGLTYEAMEVRRCIKSGLKESPLVTSEMTLEIAEILQKAREQLGYKLTQDDQW